MQHRGQGTESVPCLARPYYGRASEAFGTSREGEGVTHEGLLVCWCRAPGRECSLLVTWCPCARSGDHRVCLTYMLCFHPRVLLLCGSCGAVLLQVKIESCRPLSKHKSWTVTSILQRSRMVALTDPLNTTGAAAGATGAPGAASAPPSASASAEDAQKMDTQ